MSIFMICKEWKRFLALCLHAPLFISMKLRPKLLAFFRKTHPSKNPAYFFMKNHKEKPLWFGTAAGISSILTSFPHTHSWKIQPRKCTKKAMELQIHSMPYAKPSIEHQLSRALFTVQWYMHQIILFSWYIVQKLTNWTGRNLFKIHLLNSSFPLYE